MWRYMQLFLVFKRKIDFYTRHCNFCVSDERIVWSVQHQPISEKMFTYQLDIELDLGNKFYKEGTILNLKIAHHLSLCVRWSDVTMDWITDHCKVSFIFS